MLMFNGYERNFKGYKWMFNGFLMDSGLNIKL